MPTNSPPYNLNINDTFNDISTLLSSISQHISLSPYKYSDPIIKSKSVTLNCIAHSSFMCDSIYFAILRKKDNLWVVKKMKIVHKCPIECHSVGVYEYIDRMVCECLESVKLLALKNHKLDLNNEKVTEFNKENTCNNAEVNKNTNDSNKEDIDDLQKNIFNSNYVPRVGWMTKYLCEKNDIKICYESVYESYRRLKNNLDAHGNIQILSVDDKNSLSRSVENISVKKRSVKQNNQSESVENIPESSIITPIKRSVSDISKFNETSQILCSESINDDNVPEHSIKISADNIPSENNEKLNPGISILPKDFINIQNDLHSNFSINFTKEFLNLNHKSISSFKITNDTNFIHIQFDSLKNYVRNVLEIKVVETYDGYCIYGIVMDPNDYPIVFSLLSCKREEPEEPVLEKETVKKVDKKVTKIVKKNKYIPKKKNMKKKGLKEEDDDIDDENDAVDLEEKEDNKPKRKYSKKNVNKGESADDNSVGDIVEKEENKPKRKYGRKKSVKDEIEEYEQNESEKKRGEEDNGVNKKKNEIKKSARDEIEQDLDDDNFTKENGNKNSTKKEIDHGTGNDDNNNSFNESGVFRKKTNLHNLYDCVKLFLSFVDLKYFYIITEFNKELFDVLEQLIEEKAYKMMYIVKTRDLVKEFYKIEKSRFLVEKLFGICNGLLKTNEENINAGKNENFSYRNQNPLHKLNLSLNSNFNFSDKENSENRSRTLNFDDKENNVNRNINLSTNLIRKEDDENRHFDILNQQSNNEDNDKIIKNKLRRGRTKKIEYSSTDNEYSMHSQNKSSVLEHDHMSNNKDNFYNQISESNRSKENIPYEKIHANNELSIIDIDTYKKTIGTIQVIYPLKKERFINKYNLFNIQNGFESDMEYINVIAYTYPFIESFNTIVSSLKTSVNIHSELNSKQNYDFSFKIRSMIEKNVKIGEGFKIKKDNNKKKKKIKNTVRPQEIIECKNMNINLNMNSDNETQKNDRSLAASPLESSIFTVVSDDEKDEFTVDLKNMKCTCGRFQVYLIPCVHACALINNPYEYVSSVLSNNMFPFEYNIVPVIDDIIKANEKGYKRGGRYKKRKIKEKVATTE